MRLHIEMREVDDLIKLQGKGFALLKAVVKSGGFSREEVIVCWRCLSPRTRAIVKKRIMMYLFWRQRGYRSRRRFLKRWSSILPESRGKIMKRFRRQFGLQGRSIYFLLMMVFEKGMISKPTYKYLCKPIGYDERIRMKLSWWGFLKAGCQAVKTIKQEADKRVQGALISVQLTPSSPQIWY